MRIHGRMSAIQIELMRCTATHILDGNSWQNVSHSNWAQEVHSHSQAGCEFMAGCQPFKLSSGGAQRPKPCMSFIGIHCRIQVVQSRRTATHKLDVNSWQDVSHSN